MLSPEHTLQFSMLHLTQQVAGAVAWHVGVVVAIAITNPVAQVRQLLTCAPLHVWHRESQATHFEVVTSPKYPGGQVVMQILGPLAGEAGLSK